jgi:transposase
MRQWGTPAAYRHRLTAHRQQKRAKLANRNKKMQIAYRNGMSCEDIAEKFNVHPFRVNQIVRSEQK